MSEPQASESRPASAGTLVVAEHVQGRLRDVTKELVTAALGLGEPVTVAVMAADPSSLAEACNLEGVDEVVTVAVEATHYENDVHQAALEALMAERRPEVVLVGFTVDSMGYAPAVAAKLGLGFASDVFALAREGQAVVAQRAFYGGKVHGELTFPEDRPVLLMLRPTAWAPAEGGGQARVSQLAVPVVASRARHRELVEAPAGDVDITTADFLLSIGRGIDQRDNIPMFEALAEKMGATLSASRPLVDSGWVPSARQVGQSGKTVKPKVYLAFGISGAVQHLAGMKTANTIIAVNSDPEAAIFNVAHYGAVADLFEVAEALEDLW